MPRPSGGFTRLQHAAIKVHDIEAAKDFYVNTLGFTVSEIFAALERRVSYYAAKR